MPLQFVILKIIPGEPTYFFRHNDSESVKAF